MIRSTFLALLIAVAPAVAQEAKPAAPVNVVFKVTGMSCEGCAAKVTKKLAALPGVTVNRIDADDEVLDTTLDLAKSTKAQVIAAVVEKGYKVTGEKLDISVPTMACASCAGKIKTALAALPGVTVDTINLKEKHAHVTIDPAKTERSKVTAALATAGFPAAQP